MSVTQMPQSEAAAPEKKSKKKLIMIVGVLAVAAAAYFLVLKPKQASAEPEEPVAGEVVAMEPIQVNLAEGHYLSIGIALQLTDAATHGGDGSKALDYTIEMFTGRTVEELANPKERAKLKKELVHKVEEAYHHEVMDVDFTSFVTQ